MADYRKLKVWQKAHALSLHAHRAATRYLRFSISSASELEYNLLEAKEMHVVSDGEHLSLSGQVVEVRMMLHGLIRRLEGGDGDPGS